jgi:hypothetical protein
VLTVTDLDESNRLISWVAIATAVMAAVSLAMAVTTLPRSGPYCRSECVGYPYVDAAAFVPRDYLWIYPALVLWLLVVVLVQCIHSLVDPHLRMLSGVAVTFTAIGVGTLIVDYAIQLTFIQPALLLGETEGLTPWSQYNPYGIFIALENVGYLLLNLAFLAIGVALIRMPTKLWRIVAWIFTNRWCADPGAAAVLFRLLQGSPGLPVRSHRDTRYLARVDRRTGAAERCRCPD